MKERKYYTPEIEEFHVGFEFEGFADNGWEKESITDLRDLYVVVDRYSNTASFRVKYLDREDIESLGWKTGVQGLAVDGYSGWEEFKKDNYRMVLSDNQDLIIVSQNYNSFSGTIKNKSELKKVLKMLGIC